MITHHFLNIRPGRNKREMSRFFNKIIDKSSRQKMSMICAWCKIRNCNVYEVDVCLKAKKTEERVNDAKSKFRGGLHG